MRVVNAGEVEVDVDVAAEVDVVAAEVRVERRLDVAVLPYFSEHFLHHRLAFDLFGWAQLIKFVEPLEACRSCMTFIAQSYLSCQRRLIRSIFYGNHALFAY